MFCIKTEFDEIQRIGALVDDVDIAGCINNDILKKISEIDSYFSDEIDTSINQDFLVVYFYTKANYNTVILQKASQSFELLKTHCVYLQKFNSYSDAYFESVILRTSYMRKALSLYVPDGTLNRAYISQVHTNLANLYHECGRIIESIELLSDVRFEIPLPAINFAAKQYSLSMYCLYDSQKLFLLWQSKVYYQMVLENKESHFLIPEDQLEGVYAAYDFICEKLRSDFQEIPIWEELSIEEKLSLEIGENSYKEWCKKHLLVLSYVNTCGENSIVDDIHLPNLGIAYFGKSESLAYYSWVNTIKQEYNLARYFIYQAEMQKNEMSPHESQEYNILINTLDYPAIGFGTEILKLSLKNSYSVLDKIGLICNHFFKLEKASARADFTSWCNKIEKEVALNSTFSSLYWLGKDFDYNEGSLKNIRRLRNAIEHRYARVVDCSSNTIDEELKINY